MLSTKNVLMFAVLSIGILTALTAAEMSQGQTAFASEKKERYCQDNNDNNCNDVKQKIKQENKCKLENENENERHSDNNNNNIGINVPGVYCWNNAQNAGQDAFAQDDAFSTLNNNGPP